MSDTQVETWVREDAARRKAFLATLRARGERVSGETLSILPAAAVPRCCVCGGDIGPQTYVRHIGVSKAHSRCAEGWRDQ